MKKLIALLLLLPVLASADPGPATRWLMNEPVTLFEIGLFRAREQLQAWDEDYPSVIQVDYPLLSIHSVIRYNFSDDTYTVNLSLNGVESLESDQVRHLCGMLMNTYARVTEAQLINWFSHEGGASTGTLPPENVYRLLKHLVMLECEVFTATDVIRGRRELLNPKVYWAGDDE